MNTAFVLLEVLGVVVLADLVRVIQTRALTLAPAGARLLLLVLLKNSPAVVWLLMMMRRCWLTRNECRSLRMRQVVEQHAHVVVKKTREKKEGNHAHYEESHSGGLEPQPKGRSKAQARQGCVLCPLRGRAGRWWHADLLGEEEVQQARHRKEEKDVSQVAARHRFDQVGQRFDREEASAAAEEGQVPGVGQVQRHCILCPGLKFGAPPTSQGKAERAVLRSRNRRAR